MEREAREAKTHLVREAERRAAFEMGSIPARIEQIEELRREVGRLREELKGLGQHVKDLERTRK